MSWFKSLLRDDPIKELVRAPEAPNKMPEPYPERKPEPVGEPKVGEYWVEIPNKRDPFYTESEAIHCEILEIRSGWVRYFFSVETQTEISTFNGIYKKSDTIPVAPKPGELWDVKSVKEVNKEDPFPPESSKPIYAKILAVKDGWVQFQWGKDTPYFSGTKKRDRIVGFTNFHYKVFDTPEVDKSEEVV